MLVLAASEKLFEACKKNYYNFKDLQDLNYSEICDWLDWPDLQDGCVFEQCIEIAANMVLGILGFKPVHGLK